MFCISLSFIKRKTLGEDLESNGLKTRDAGPGLGINLGCPELRLGTHGQFGQRCWPGTWGAGGHSWTSFPSAGGVSSWGETSRARAPGTTSIWGRGHSLQNIPNPAAAPGACPNLISLNYDKVQASPWPAPRLQSGPGDAPRLRGPRFGDQGDELFVVADLRRWGGGAMSNLAISGEVCWTWWAALEA